MIKEQITTNRERIINMNKNKENSVVKEAKNMNSLHTMKNTIKFQKLAMVTLKIKLISSMITTQISNLKNNHQKFLKNKIAQTFYLFLTTLLNRQRMNNSFIILNFHLKPTIQKKLTKKIFKLRQNINQKNPINKLNLFNLYILTTKNKNKNKKKNKVLGTFSQSDF